MTIFCLLFFLLIILWLLPMLNEAMPVRFPVHSSLTENAEIASIIHLVNLQLYDTALSASFVTPYFTKTRQAVER